MCVCVCVCVWRRAGSRWSAGLTHLREEKLPSHGGPHLQHACHIRFIPSCHLTHEIETQLPDGPALLLHTHTHTHEMEAQLPDGPALLLHTRTHTHEMEAVARWTRPPPPHTHPRTHEMEAQLADGGPVGRPDPICTPPSSTVFLMCS